MLGLALGVGVSSLRRGGTPWSVTPDRLLDGSAPVVLLDMPRNVFRVATGAVAIGDLLGISTGSKRVIGPTGSLVTVAANQPAFDWSTGRRRLLVEAKSATKYGPNSETMGSGGWSLSRATCISGAAIGPDGAAGLSKIVEDDTAASTHSINVGTSYRPTAAAAGEYWAARIVLAPGAGSRHASVRFAGTALSTTTGVTLDLATGAMIATPGSPTATRVSALAGGQWLVEFTVVTVQAGTVYGLVYVTDAAGNTTYDGDGVSHVFAGYYNAEKVDAPTELTSSYVTIPSNAAVTRIADDIRLSSATLAILNGAGSTLCLRGQLDAAPVGTQFLVGDASARRLLYTAGADGKVFTYYGDVSVSASAGSGVLSTGIGAVIARFLGGASKLCLNGGPVANLTTDPAETLATARLFADAAGGGACNGWIDEIVIWPSVGSDAAIQAQAHVYGA